MSANDEGNPGQGAGRGPGAGPGPADPAIAEPDEEPVTGGPSGLSIVTPLTEPEYELDRPGSDAHEARRLRPGEEDPFDDNELQR